MLSHKRKIAKNKKVKDQQGRFLRLRKNTLALYFFKPINYVKFFMFFCFFIKNMILYMGHTNIRRLKL